MRVRVVIDSADDGGCCCWSWRMAGKKYIIGVAAAVDSGVFWNIDASISHCGCEDDDDDDIDDNADGGDGGDVDDGGVFGW